MYQKTLMKRLWREALETGVYAYIYVCACVCLFAPETADWCTVQPEPAAGYPLVLWSWTPGRGTMVWRWSPHSLAPTIRRCYPGNDGGVASLKWRVKHWLINFLLSLSNVLCQKFSKKINCKRELFKKKLKDLKGAILDHLCILFCVFGFPTSDFETPSPPRFWQLCLNSMCWAYILWNVSYIYGVHIHRPIWKKACGQCLEICGLFKKNL